VWIIDIRKQNALISQYTPAQYQRLARRSAVGPWTAPLPASPLRPLNTCHSSTVYLYDLMQRRKECISNAN
jgi:hypothetical protein